MPQQALTAAGWQFADTTDLHLLDKIRKAGTPLGEYVNNRFYYGIKTGFNQAFVVDRATRDRLVAEHPSSAEVLKPFLRGRDQTTNHHPLSTNPQTLPARTRRQTMDSGLSRFVVNFYPSWH